MAASGESFVFRLQGPGLFACEAWDSFVFPLSQQRGRFVRDGVDIIGQIMRRDFVVQISIFSMPRCLGSESPSMLEIKNYRNPYKYVEGGKRTGTTTEQTFDRSLRDCCVFGF